ncbi:unnamed protein product [Medioppia subpectinata]|uniref:C-type lectin domain-containing protein n=1 Tax=Medioppia subpectinata TaxID=1979941 RepID=A0A7R9PW84_9ACAR|nr:unnamed protein product [Medioppia subpectinata]CAG2103657.1 unnamed protein product [Medioppia subpectinata]
MGRGFDLLEIHTLNENFMVFQALQETNASLHLQYDFNDDSYNHNKPQLWIGPKRVPFGGVNDFQYRSGCSIKDYNRWHKGQPNDHLNREDCVFMVIDDPMFLGQWEDYSCDTEMYYIFLLIIIYILYITGAEVRGPVRTQPEQIHLSYGADSTQMMVTWTTFNATNTSTVEFGKNSLDQTLTGLSASFIDGGNESRQIFIHRVMLTQLTPGDQYIYHCGSTDGWSPLFKFNATKNGSDWSPRIAVFGDLGNENSQSIPRLQEDVQRGLYDSIFHIGPQ